MEIRRLIKRQLYSSPWKRTIFWTWVVAIEVVRNNWDSKKKKEIIGTQCVFWRQSKLDLLIDWVWEKKKRQGSCANLKVGTLGEDSEVNRNFCYSEKSWLSLEGNHNAVQLVLFKVIWYIFGIFVWGNPNLAGRPMLLWSSYLPGHAECAIKLSYLYNQLLLFEA